MWKSHYTLANVTISLSTPLNRWLKTTTIVLKKHRGKPKINRLRIIGKFEVDYNLLLKLFCPQNVAEPKVHSLLISHPTYVNIIFSKKLSIAPKSLHTHST